MSNSFYHEPVLLGEVIDLLVTDREGGYCDCTLGGGGHLRAIARITGVNAVLIGIDRDSDAIDWNKKNKIETVSRVILSQSVFSEFDKVLNQNDIKSVNGILLDLGVSSFQIDKAERGFTYMRESNLDMRMNRQDAVSAAEKILMADETELATLLKEYGEIRNAYRMAHAIKTCPFPLKTSTDLKNCLAHEYGNLKPEILARIFQALRISVNDELNELLKFLDKAYTALSVGGRLAVISYHSLEDRIVKEFFRNAESSCCCPKEQPECTCKKVQSFRRITKKAVQASEMEKKCNSRSRSARLRVAEKVSG